MPDLLSIALGGGTRVEPGEPIRIGPSSVGDRITTDALVFGGDTLTLSDVAVADGRAAMGDASRVAHLDPELVRLATDQTRRMCADVIDRIKTSAEPQPIVLVGGGSVVIPQDLGAAPVVHRPDHYDVANAIGAAIAQCSGEIERVFSLETHTRQEALDVAQELARAEAIKAGALPETVHIIDVHEVPLAYLPGNATRIRERAAGDLSLNGVAR